MTVGETVESVHKDSVTFAGKQSSGTERSGVGTDDFKRAMGSAQLSWQST